jgi:hypothetical protein
MKQREHEALDKFPVLKKSLTAAGWRQKCAKLQKLVIEATSVFAFLTLRRGIE